MLGSLYRVQFIRVMCRRRCSHVGCVKRGRLVVGMSRPSHHGTTSYFAQLAAFSLDHETLQQRFVIPLPSFLRSWRKGRNSRPRLTRTPSKLPLLSPFAFDSKRIFQKVERAIRYGFQFYFSSLAIGPRGKDGIGNEIRIRIGNFEIVFPRFYDF